MNIKIKVNGNKNITHDKIKARLGVTDKKNHSVFYLEGGAFIIPNEDIDDFVEVMATVEAACRRLIKNKLLKHHVLDTNFIMNFESCSDRMKKDKSTYLSFQYHFKQKNNENTSIIRIKDENEFFFIGLLDDIENELLKHNILINKTRKTES